MKIKSLLFCCLLFLFLACNRSAAPEKNIEKIKLTAFSHSTRLDTFKIALKGDETKNMSLIFTITSYQGKQIYHQNIKATELLKNYINSADLKKENKKIKFLDDEVNYFFDEEHFLIPAVMSTETPDHNVPDHSFFKELKQSQLSGFTYRLGKDVNVYIAWSEKEKKVKIYYKCCQ